MYSISSRVLLRINRSLARNVNLFEHKLKYKTSWDYAHKLRKILVNNRGSEIVNWKIKKKIKEYSKNKFGQKSFWPWLALYTEIRGEFIEGWIPYDVYRFKILPKVNPKKFMVQSESKTIDHKLFGDMVVPPLVVRLQGNYFDVNGKYLSKSEVYNLLTKTSEELVIKPDDGRRGSGILFIKSNEISLGELPFESDLVIQKKIDQHDSLGELNPYSVNTLRVMTHLNNFGKVNVKFVNLRFGVGRSRTDNVSDGGGWVSINKTGKANNLAFNKNGFKLGNKHPNTNFRFSELNIHCLEEIELMCCNAHKKFPYVSLIGWDVIIDKRMNPYILEWNANNPWFWNVEALVGPLWPDHSISI